MKTLFPTTENKIAKTATRALAALVLAAALLPLPARAGIGAFATWWDGKDFGEMTGGGAKVAIGLPLGFWVEARGSCVTGDGDGKADVVLVPLEALAAWQLELAPFFRPYAGAGVGWYGKDFSWKGEWKRHRDRDAEKDCAGYFALAGLSVGLGNVVSLFGEAKYTLLCDGSSLEWRGSDLKEKNPFDGLSVNVGLKLGF